jgi:hypothetical protein
MFVRREKCGEREGNEFEQQGERGQHQRKAEDGESQVHD